MKRGRNWDVRHIGDGLFPVWVLRLSLGDALLERGNAGLTGLLGVPLGDALVQHLVHLCGELLLGRLLFGWRYLA